MTVRFDTADCSGGLKLNGTLLGQPDARQLCLCYITPLRHCYR